MSELCATIKYIGLHYVNNKNVLLLLLVLLPHKVLVWHSRPFTFPLYVGVGGRKGSGESSTLDWYSPTYVTSALRAK